MCSFTVHRMYFFPDKSSCINPIDKPVSFTCCTNAAPKVSQFTYLASSLISCFENTVNPCLFNGKTEMRAEATWGIIEICIKTEGKKRKYF